MNFASSSMQVMFARQLGIQNWCSKQQVTICCETANLNFVELRRKEHGKLGSIFSSRRLGKNLVDVDDINPGNTSNNNDDVWQASKIEETKEGGTSGCTAAQSLPESTNVGFVTAEGKSMTGLHVQLSSATTIVRARNL